MNDELLRRLTSAIERLTNRIERLEESLPNPDKDKRREAERLFYATWDEPKLMEILGIKSKATLEKHFKSAKIKLSEVRGPGDDNEWYYKRQEKIERLKSVQAKAENRRAKNLPEKR